MHDHHHHTHLHHIEEHASARLDGRASASRRHRARLSIVLGLTLAYSLIEAGGAFLTNSLALLADAAHMLADSFGLGMALFAIWLAQRSATPQRTYGYFRTEILAALINSFLLLGICV